ncbi:MAG TPA: sugar phosphate isomerase/epimerase family protein [Terracidiphilus sp.]|nr:sugar phosphate isomerase/epimerase family protein [Terracidiphilus sp.]
MDVSRRHFISGSAATLATLAASAKFLRAVQAKSLFKIAVISDEISQDFDHACSVIANDFGLKWVEIRGMWGKGLQNLSDDELDRAQKILTKYKLRVTDIGSPLFKIDWPGAPRSRFSPKKSSTQSADSQFQQQREVLERHLALAKRFKTNAIRCFDFHRLDDVKPYREAINAKLLEAANICGKHKVRLVLENEFDCNTGSGREAAETLAAIQSPHFMLNWDAGNAVMGGELDAFPAGWDLLPKNRIGHCHCKNAVKGDDGKIHWSPVDIGYIDWTAQFRALAKTGYRGAVSLETHWRGAATPEESTRRSWHGMEKALKDSGALA